MRRRLTAINWARCASKSVRSHHLGEHAGVYEGLFKNYNPAIVPGVNEVCVSGVPELAGQGQDG